MYTERFELIKFAVAVDEILKEEIRHTESIAEGVRMRRNVVVAAVRDGMRFADELKLTPQQYTRRALAVLMARTDDTRRTVNIRSIFCKSIRTALKNNEDASLYSVNDEATVDWFDATKRKRVEPLVQKWLMGLCLFAQKRKYQKDNGMNLTDVEAMWFYRVALPTVFMWDYIPYRNMAKKNLCASLDGSSERSLIMEHQTLLSCPTTAHIKSNSAVIKWKAAVGKDSELMAQLFKL